MLKALKLYEASGRSGGWDPGSDRTCHFPLLLCCSDGVGPSSLGDAIQPCEHMADPAVRWDKALLGMVRLRVGSLKARFLQVSSFLMLLLFFPVSSAAGSGMKPRGYGLV